MEAATLEALAQSVRDQFELAKRTDGSEYWTRKSAARASDWVQAMCYAAHGDMGPDDVKYEYIVDALDIIAEHGDDGDAAHEVIDQAVDIYTHDLTAWLASHNARSGYVDEAREEYGEARDTMHALQMGQYKEREEVYGAVLSALRAEVDA